MDSHLSILGFAKMPILGNILTILSFAIFFVVVPYESVQVMSALLIFALFPAFAAKIQYIRKFKLFQDSVTLDKGLIFALLMQVDFISADYLRIIIFTFVLIILTGIPFLRYDLQKDDITPIAAKIIIIAVFSVFFTMMLNLGLLILALSKNSFWDMKL